MPNFEKIIKSLEAILKLIFGDHVPVWILRVIGYLLLVAFILLALWGLLLILSKIKKLWVDDFQPFFYNPEEKRRKLRRQRFADHVESEIRRLNALEVWSDYRFAELEADVEAEGLRNSLTFWPFVRRGRRGLRLERSLSEALKYSQDRLIILEGDPGAGKSIALRHVAQTMAQKVMKARSTKSIIPIYVNLKELERKKDKQPIDRNLIQSFILQYLNKFNDRDIEEYLESEFIKGLQEGTWLFLFDSFDELPEILSSTEADDIIRKYGDAISAFLHGFNKCRGIIASRQFRGPNQFGWPRFRILPLSEERRLELVHKVGLKPEVEKEIIGNLAVARQEVYLMAGNPMFLGLLCEYMGSGNSFPENVHNVFETYIETRLNRDKDRLLRRFKVEPLEVRKIAEDVAFCMASDSELGLSPTRKGLKDAAIRQHIVFDKRFALLLDALEYLKLARSDSASSAETRSFTFAHRRFQEYFATRALLKNPNSVAPHKLLTDARWRETTIVMCQTQPLENLLPLIKETESILCKIIKSIPALQQQQADSSEIVISSEKDQTELIKPLSIPFPWPPRTLHLLELLQEGFANRLNELPVEIRKQAGNIILFATRTGTLSDKKWGLEVAGIVPQPDLHFLLQNAFKSTSLWLRDVAYKQVSRLSQIPTDIAGWIRLTLVNMALAGTLKRNEHAVYAHLKRLEKSFAYLPITRLLLWAFPIDLILHGILLLTIIPLLIHALRYIDNQEGYSNSGVPWYLPYLVLFLPFLALPLSYFSLWRGFRKPTDQIRSVYILSMVMVMRVSMFLIIPMIIDTFRRIGVNPFPEMPGLYLPIFIMTAWAPFALFGAAKGRFVRLMWWPFMIICAPVLLIQDLMQAAKPNLKVILKIFISEWKKLKNNWKKILLKILKDMVKAFGALLLLVILFISGIVLFSIFRRGGMITETGISITLLILLFISISMLFLAYPGFMLFKFLKDLRLWLIWSHNQSSPISGIEFLNQFEQYTHFRFCLKLTRFVRERNHFVITKETYTYIQELALALESGLIIKHDKVRSKSNGDWLYKLTGKEILNPVFQSVSKEFDDWYKHYIQKRRWIMIFSPRTFYPSELIDEMYKLLEQSQAYLSEYRGTDSL
jgi:hypothetical protein